MKLTESQHSHLKIVKDNLDNSSDDHTAFLNSMEALLTDGVNVQRALKEHYHMEL